MDTPDTDPVALGLLWHCAGLARRVFEPGGALPAAIMAAPGGLADALQALEA